MLGPCIISYKRAMSQLDSRQTDKQPISKPSQSAKAWLGFDWVEQYNVVRTLKGFTNYL